MDSKKAEECSCSKIKLLLDEYFKADYWYSVNQTPFSWERVCKAKQDLYDAVGGEPAA